MATDRVYWATGGSDGIETYAEVTVTDREIVLHLKAPLRLPPNAEVHRPEYPPRALARVLLELSPQAREILVQFLRPRLGETP